MPLHPKLQRILPRLPKLPLEPELSAIAVSELRRVLNVSSSLPALALARVEDRTLPLVGRTLRARLYATSHERDLPAVVYFHGGGFVVGTLDTHDNVARKLAHDTGACVISIDYRLAPEHPFPAAACDAYDSVAWLSRHGSEWGIDAMRIAVAGDSAGGNLAAVACLLARDAGGPNIRHQALVYPVTDARCTLPSFELYGRGYMLTSDLMRLLWRTYLQGADGHDSLASPLLARLEGLPEATLITAEYDALRDEAIAYADALSCAGVAVVHQHYDDLVHGFATMWQSLPPAALALELVATRLAAALKT